MNADATNATSPVYVRLNHGDVARTREVADDVLVDYDDTGTALGVEILGAESVTIDGRTASAAPEISDPGRYEDRWALDDIAELAGFHRDEDDTVPTIEDLREGLRTLTAENQHMSRLLAASVTEEETACERIAAVKRRHYPDVDLGDLQSGETEQQRTCVECGLPWPCATWTALTEPSGDTVQAPDVAAGFVVGRTGASLGSLWNAYVHRSLAAAQALIADEEMNPRYWSVYALVEQPSESAGQASPKVPGMRS